VNLTVARSTEQLVARSLDSLRIVDAQWMDGMRGDGTKGSVPRVTVASAEGTEADTTLALLAEAQVDRRATPNQARWTFVATEGFGDVVALLQIHYHLAEAAELRIAFRVPGHEVLLAGVRDARRLLFGTAHGPQLVVDPPVDDLAAVLRLIERAGTAVPH
jgi:hypothetical protein